MEVINDILDKGLKIYQNSDYFKFSLESILLPEFVDVNLRDKKILDLCSGNAPIPLILSQKTKAHIYGVEIQKEIYDLGIKSIKENKKEEQITLLNMDVKGLKTKFLGDTFDIITVNPPYFKVLSTSLQNKNIEKADARHENLLKLEELLPIVSYLLKTNGAFYMVHRTERFLEIIEKLNKVNLIPKKVQFLYPNTSKDSKLFFIKAVKNGHHGLKVIDGLYTNTLEEVNK